MVRWVLGWSLLSLWLAARAYAQEAPSREWTLERAQRVWKPMVRPVQHVGVPGYQFQAGVMWDGSLVFGPLDFLDNPAMKAETAPLGHHFLHLSIGFGEPMRLVDRHGSNRPAIRRGLEDGRLPIAHVETRDGDLVWHETVLAHLLDRKVAAGLDPKPTDTLVVQMRMSVRNAGAARRTAHLWLHFGDTSQVRFGYKCAMGDALAPSIPHSYASSIGTVDGKVRYVLPSPFKGAVTQHQRVQVEGSKTAAERALEWTVELGPREEADIRLVLPYGLVGLATGERLVRLDWAREHAEARDYWRRLSLGPGRITTPDPFVNDYVAAVTCQMAQQTAYRQAARLWMYKTSPNHYEVYWPCNAAKAIPTFDLRGRSDLDERVLSGFVQSRTSDVRGMDRGVMGRAEGLASEGYERIDGFLGNFGDWTANPLLLSHGLGMWALAAHYRITRDDRWLNAGAVSPLKTMIDAFDWVTKQRSRTKREVDGKRVPHWGLLPAASAHDWLAGNTIFNDDFCIYGMAEVVRLLREIAHPRAEEMAAELSDYRACLRDRYREARDRARPVPLADGTTIPYVPRIVQELDWTKPDWTYSGYSATRVGAWGALDPDDELVTQTLTFLDAGMPKGEGPYYAPQTYNTDIADANWADVSDPNAARHWLWRHYVEYETMWPVGGPLFLERDDLPRFFEWLFNNLAVVIHRDWRVGVESLDGVPSCAPGDGERWQLIRRMFVNERGGGDGSEQSLWLMQAIPRCWLRPGNRMTVDEMGTFFGGRLDLACEVAKDGDSCRVTTRLRGLKATPRKIQMRLRSGDARPLRSATVNGASVPVLPGDTIALPAVREAKWVVVARY